MAGREKTVGGKRTLLFKARRVPLLTAPAAFAPFTNRSPLFFLTAGVPGSSTRSTPWRSWPIVRCC